MDFKSYYHNRLNEEGNIDEPLDADAPVKEAPVPQKATGGTGIIAPYVSNTSLKLGLKKLGEDIGLAIVEYATKQAVQPTDFKSQDDYVQYCREIRTAVAEKSNEVVINTLQNIGIFIDEKIHRNCPNK